MGGFIAGIVFAIVEMLEAAIVGGSIFDPLRMIASIPLQLPPPEIAIETALVFGTLFHIVLAIILGIIGAYSHYRDSMGQDGRWGNNTRGDIWICALDYKFLPTRATVRRPVVPHRNESAHVISLAHIRLRRSAWVVYLIAHFFGDNAAKARIVVSRRPTAR